MNLQVEHPPSPRPSPPGEGARWMDLESFENYFPRSHGLEEHAELADAASAAICSGVPKDLPLASPLLGERVRVRAGHPLAFASSHSSYRACVAWQRMRRAFLKLTKNGVANHLRSASQPRVPEAKFFDAEGCEILRPLIISLALLRKAVLRSIKFNREPPFLAKKVQRVNAGWVLAAEFIAAEPSVPQPAPDGFLRPGRVLAKLSGFVGGHEANVEKRVRIRKNRLTPALTPALSPRRGSATGSRGEMRSRFSAFSSFGDSHRILRHNERGEKRSSGPKRITRVPSPGGEGQGEGEPTFSHLPSP